MEAFFKDKVARLFRLHSQTLSRSYVRQCSHFFSSPDPPLLLLGYDQAQTGSINTRVHQLRQPALNYDGSLALNGISILASPSAGHRNPETGDCHPGTLDRHNGVYITKKTPRMRAQSPQSNNEDYMRDGGDMTPRPPPLSWRENAFIRFPRGGGLGPEMSPRKGAAVLPGGSPPRSPRSPLTEQKIETGDNASEVGLSPRRRGPPTGMLTKAGSFSALKSFNETLTKGHVDRGDFLDRAFVPSHPNSQFAARIPADYETFQGSMDKWAAGPGGGVEGMHGHREGSWQDVHAPGKKLWILFLIKGYNGC